MLQKLESADFQSNMKLTGIVCQSIYSLWYEYEALLKY